MGNSCVQLFARGEYWRCLHIVKEKLDKYSKERFIMGYQLDKPKYKLRKSSETETVKGWKKVVTHTHCSSKPSQGIYLRQWQKETGLDEPLSWISIVILIYLSEETWNYYFSFKLEETRISPLKGKRFPIGKCGYFSPKETHKPCSLHFP